MNEKSYEITSQKLEPKGDALELERQRQDQVWSLAEPRKPGGMQTRNPGKKTHGMSKTRIYGRWRAMVRRCTCPRDHAWKWYGERGIRVCTRWLYFENFIADMGFPPDESFEIERRDNNSHYTPSNCSWKTRLEQMRNNRANTLLSLGGETKCISEWSESTLIEPRTLAARVTRYKWSVERALTEKPRICGTNRFRGVSFMRKNKKWMAEILVRGKHVYLGLFTDEVAAAKAYNSAAVALGVPERVNLIT